MPAMQRGATLLLAASIVGCSGGADAVAGIERDVGSLQPSFANTGLQQRVTGHANMILGLLGGAEQKYSQSAIRHADGTVTGQFQLQSEQVEPALRIHGAVTCFTIVPTPQGGVARLGGVIEKSNTPLAPEGVFVVWTVIDNGEGANDPADLTSDFFPTSALGAELHCEIGFNLAPFMPVVGGNLQVHP